MLKNNIFMMSISITILFDKKLTLFVSDSVFEHKYKNKYDIRYIRHISDSFSSSSHGDGSAAALLAPAGTSRGVAMVGKCDMPPWSRVETSTNAHHSVRARVVEEKLRGGTTRHPSGLAVEFCSCSGSSACPFFCSV